MGVYSISHDFDEKHLNKNPLQIIITIKCWSFSSVLFNKTMIEFILGVGDSRRM